MFLLKTHARRAEPAIATDARLLKADQEYSDWKKAQGTAAPHHTAYTRTSASGAVSQIEAKGSPTVHYHAGADVPTAELRQGTFTTPDRAAAEQFARTFGHPKIHEMHLNDLGKKTATRKEVEYYARKVGIYERGTPIGQYFERDLHPDGKVQKLINLLALNGYSTAQIDDGMSSHPTTVILWPKTIEPLTKARALQGSIDYRGLPCSIETGRSRMRQWYDEHNDQHGITRMNHPYGYIKGSLGTDGDEVDIIIGPDPEAPEVYVIHINKAPAFTTYDEDKCFAGMRSPEEALRCFRAMYDKPGFFGSMSVWPFDDFKEAVFARKGERLDNTRWTPPTESANGMTGTAILHPSHLLADKAGIIKG